MLQSAVSQAERVSAYQIDLGHPDPGQIRINQVKPPGRPCNLQNQAAIICLTLMQTLIMFFGTRVPWGHRSTYWTGTLHPAAEGC